MLGAGCSQLAARAPCFIHQDTNARHRQHTDWNGFRAFSNCDTQGWRVTAVHCDKDSACTAAASRLKLALAAVGAAALVSAASPGRLLRSELRVLTQLYPTENILPCVAWLQPGCPRTGLVHATEKVGEFAASGFIFKDTVEVVSVEDSDGAPDAVALPALCSVTAQFDAAATTVTQLRAVPGVQLYISEFKRSLTDKLAKDFFSEPSQVRVAFTRRPSCLCGSSSLWRGQRMPWGCSSSS